MMQDRHVELTPGEFFDEGRPARFHRGTAARVGKLPTTLVQLANADESVAQSGTEHGSMLAEGDVPPLPVLCKPAGFDELLHSISCGALGSGLQLRRRC